MARRAAFSSDGRLLLTWDLQSRSGGGEGGLSDLCLWDAASGKRLHSLAEKADYRVGEQASAAVFSHDSKHVASGAADGVVKRWNVETGKLEQTYRGHEKRIRVIEFSRDDKTLLTASEDGTIRIWDTSMGDDAPYVVRIWPADPLAEAKRRKPRELTAAERKRYEVDGVMEALMRDGRAERRKPPGEPRMRNEGVFAMMVASGDESAYPW